MLINEEKAVDITTIPNNQEGKRQGSVLPVQHYESDEEQNEFRTLARTHGYNTVDPLNKQEEFTPHQRVNESSQKEDKKAARDLRYANDSRIIEEEDSKLSERNLSKFSH